MRRYATLVGGLAAATLMMVAAASAQPGLDPMAALVDAPPYVALQPSGVAPAAPAAAVPDPMAAAAAGAATTTEAITTRAEDPNPDLGGLPNGPGAEETYYQCVACHSTAIIRQQRITDGRWDYLWNWMIEKQGMVAPDEETKGVILGYLKQHFSSER